MQTRNKGSAASFGAKRMHRCHITYGHGCLLRRANKHTDVCTRQWDKHIRIYVKWSSCMYVRIEVYRRTLNYMNARKIDTEAHTYMHAHATWPRTTIHKHTRAPKHGNTRTHTHTHAQLRSVTLGHARSRTVTHGHVRARTVTHGNARSRTHARMRARMRAHVCIWAYILAREHAHQCTWHKM